MDPKYEGPYKIIIKIGETTYVVEEGNEQYRFHASQIKNYKHPKVTEEGQPENKEQKFNKKQTSTLSLIFLYGLLLPIIVKSNEFGPPIVWKNTNRIFLKGSFLGNHTILIVNPSIVIDDYKHNYDNGAFYEHTIDDGFGYKCTLSWNGDSIASYHGCKEYMENNLTRTWCIDKIDEICFEYTNANDIFYIARQSCLKYVQQKMNELVTLFAQNTQLATKRKRDFGVTSIILGISLLVLRSTTIYTYLISNPKTKDEIIEEFMTTSTEIQKSLQKNLMTTANELSELKVRVMKLEHLTFANSFRSSDISFKINHLIQIMREIKNSIGSQSTLPPSMFRYFNIILPCGDSFPFNTISEAKCNLLKDETGKWFLRFQFKILNTETELKLQKADPFTLIQQQNETICLKKYQGPEFIDIKKTSNELCEIKS